MIIIIIFIEGAQLAKAVFSGASLVNIDKETKPEDWGRVASQPTPSPLYLPTKRLPVF